MKPSPRAICLAIAGILIFPACSATAVESDPTPTLVASPHLIPAFSMGQSDYAVRCKSAPVNMTIHVPDGWRAQVGKKNAGPGKREIALPIKQGQGKTFSFRRLDGGKRKTYHVRCLPDDFGPFRVSSSREGGPRLTMLQLSNGYAGAFDRRGAPVWWYQADSGSTAQVHMNTENAQFMPDGTFSYAPINGYFGRQFQVRTLEGKLVRELVAANGLKTDLHDLILLPNGNYLLGAHRMVENINTSRFGGAKNATIDTAQVQELRPNGKLVWKWDAWPRVKLAETGRWWKHIVGWGQPYDIHHWNSIERRGSNILMSFRHLDAILLINRKSGKIKWKLGGTRTSKRLRISNDPWGKYPFGGQHDARFEAGNSVTLFDNETNLSRPDNQKPPRAVRYKIMAGKKSARMLEQVKDKDARNSIGFGSARLVNRGNWIVDWGATGSEQLVGGYRSNGSSLFRLQTPMNLSYRAIPAEGKKPTIERLRLAMDRMYKKGRK